MVIYFISFKKVNFIFDNTKYRNRRILLKRVIKWFIFICLMAILIISLAGIYKFNYLASLPGYDVDGNKIETERTER